MSWDWVYRPYVSVAERRALAQKHAQKLARAGVKLAPVNIVGRTIAKTFWGRAWCDHLESLGDYINRLPRGRTYVRNGSVLDVQVAPGKITATVMGSSLYQGTIAIAPLKPAQWSAIKAECAGKIDSLIGLLQGRLSAPVMRIITHRTNGLFPQPAEIELGCSCPDHANLCKHLAAVLYGVGARLDLQPELLFVLRGVDHLELIGAATDASPLASAGSGAADLANLSEVFGIEIESAPEAPAPAAVSSRKARKPVEPSRKKAAAPARKTAPQRTKKSARGKAKRKAA